MQSNYTEADTERVRQQERLSAGYPAPVPALHQPTMRQRNNIFALGLIGIGVLTLLSRFFGDSDGLTASFILFTIASGHLFFAFSKRIFGLMIPGSILTGLALGIPFADLTHGVSIVWGLALAFGAIAVLGQNLFHVRSSWAKIPAAILFMVGMIIAVVNLPTIFGMGMMWIPLLLIGAGLYFGWGRHAHI